MQHYQKAWSAAGTIGHQAICQTVQLRGQPCQLPSSARACGVVCDLPLLYTSRSKLIQSMLVLLLSDRVEFLHKYKTPAHCKFGMHEQGLQCEAM